MMYYLDSRWRRQALVYFGEPARLGKLAYGHTRMPFLEGVGGSSHFSGRPQGGG